MDKTKLNDLVAQRDAFHGIRSKLEGMIGGHQSNIAQSQKQIDLLIKRIDFSRPRIDDANMALPCERCDTYTMTYVDEATSSEKRRTYECQICGYRSENNHA